MKIKWVMFIFVLLTFLQSCTNNSQLEFKNQVMTLPQEMAEEAPEFWLSSAGLPQYALIESPEILDMIVLEEGHPLDFNFAHPEKLKGLMIDVASKMEIRLEVEDKELFFKLDEGINQFELNLDQVTKHARITAINIENKGAQVNNILFETFQKVEEETYHAYLQKEAGMIDFTLAVDWTHDSKENLSFVDKLLERYPFNNWHYYVTAIDFNQLVKTPEAWLGYPVFLSGPVDHHEKEAHLNKVHIKNGLLDVPVIVYIDGEVDLDACINTVGVFLGYEDGLIFYSQGDTLDQ